MLCPWVIAASPSGRYARQIGFLYEFLTGKTLRLPAGTQISGNYVPILDERYITAPAVKVTRWHVDDNLLGGPAFSPVVRTTEAVQAGARRNWRAEIDQVLEVLFQCPALRAGIAHVDRGGENLAVDLQRNHVDRAVGTRADIEAGVQRAVDGGHTDRDPQLIITARHTHPKRRHGLDQALGNSCHLLQRAVAQDQPVLIATQPGEQVGLSQPRTHPSRHITQHLVTGQVSALVIDTLEVIEVQQQQVMGALSRQRNTPHGIQFGHEGTAVG